MKYNVIYTDNNWEYRNRHKIRRDGKKSSFGIGVSDRYLGGVKSTDELKSLPVQDIAEPNCALFMWAVPPCLPDAIECMDAWGFRYITIAFTWVKTNLNNGKPWFGVGSYTKSNVELCLLGMRGTLERKSHKVSQIIMQPHIRKDGKIWHSAKPPIVRDKIVELFGYLPRVELFARTCGEGWDACGLEYNNQRVEDFLDECNRTNTATSCRL
jgi:N6-adenosine-specific RNA methylase IME4